MLVTQKEYARRKRVSPQYVNKLVQQGKIKLVGRRVDVRQADAAVKAWARAGRVIPAKRSAKKPARAKRAATSSSEIDKPLAAPRDSATRSLTAARAQNEYYKAELAKLEYEQKKGELLPRADVLEAERRKNGNIRASLLAIPRIVAPLVFNLQTSSPAEIEELIRQYVCEALDQCARDPLGLEAAIEQVLPIALPVSPAIPAEAAAQ
jgi:hypothetical protein